jgi:hypothetical protein
MIRAEGPSWSRGASSLCRLPMDRGARLEASLVLCSTSLPITPPHRGGDCDTQPLKQRRKTQLPAQQRLTGYRGLPIIHHSRIIVVILGDASGLLYAG